jgi:hypothetical protein
MLQVMHVSQGSTVRPSWFLKHDLAIGDYSSTGVQAN